jgi:glycosyltransferase involved in cell wall biosynthesis
LLTQLHRNGQFDVAAILMNDGELARRLRGADIAVDVLDESRRGFGALVLGTRRVLKTRRPVLVHTHRQKENLLGVLAAWPLGIPSVRTVHGASESATTGALKRLLAWLDGWMAVHCQKGVIAVSGDLAAQLQRRLPGARIVTIPNGIDIETVRLAAHPPADLGRRHPAERQVGIVGRLDSVKRVDIFLDMAAELLRRKPDGWQFHVFGEGQLRKDLEAQAARLGIAGHVVFHGHRMDIAACLAGLDALVMCSDHEGLPMTPLEALAVGTPVVAHAVGGLVEVLHHEARGMLVEAHQPGAYADAVARIFTTAKPETPSQMSDREPRFSAASNAVAVTALYRDVLTGRSR